MRRLDSICAGDTNRSDVFDPSVEWEGFATDTFGGLGAHTANCTGPDAAPDVGVPGEQVALRGPPRAARGE